MRTWLLDLLFARLALGGHLGNGLEETSTMYGHDFATRI